jgi:hypothetical protein
MVTAAEVLLIIITFNADWFRNLPAGGFPSLRLILTVFLISLPFFAQLDSRSRYQNYKLLRDRLYMFGFHQRLLKPFAHSSCQRRVAYVAASHFGYTGQCKAYYESLGYRWYHILPDFVFKTPIYFLKKQFWTTTFLVKYYKCRISYQDIRKKGQLLINRQESEYTQELILNIVSSPICH